MYAFCIWLGMKITGDTMAVPDIAWNELTLTSTYAILKPYLWSYLAGTLVVSAAVGFISYFLFYWAIVRYRKADKTKD